MQTTLEQGLTEIDGDTVDANIRAAQRGVSDDDQRLAQARIYEHPSGYQISAAPDPMRTGKWIPIIIGRGNAVEELVSRHGTERDAMQVALSEVEGRTK